MLSEKLQEEHTCHKSGEVFTLPDGAKCGECKNWFTTKYYIYVDMEAICLDCRKGQVKRIIKNIKMQLNQGS